MNPLLEIKNLSIDFISERATTQAVKNISFTVERGEIVAIVGESGSGKTVTALSILQLIPSPPVRYSSGQILFSENGRSVENLLEKKHKHLQSIRGNKISIIFQEPMTSLNPVFTCGHQVVESIKAHKKISASKARREALEWFLKVKLPEPRKIFNRYPHQLSGGQKQRVMIAMAICCHPSLLICDEPTTALDVTVQNAILQLIRDLQREQNMGVIFITHDLGVVGEVADKTIAMYKGEIVEKNSVREIFTHPQHPYTKALLACRPVNHLRGERLPVVSDFLSSAPTRIDHSVPGEKELTNVQLPARENHQQDVLLHVKNLSVRFSSKKNLFGKSIEFVRAVNNVSFQVYKGETLGLVGESGCGKTTLGRTLLRLIEPSSGKITYKGEDLTTKKRSELKSLRKEIQIIFQDPYSSLNPRITIGDAISEPIKVHEIVFNAKKRKEKVMELLEKVGLNAEHFNRYPHEFSGGQRQRIVIARALALHPSFIVCDEPVSALDVSVQAQILNLLNDLKKEFNFTTVFISHDLSVVRYISDRILVMNKGKIEESGNADDIYLNPQKEYTKKLIASIPKGNLYKS